LRTVFLAHAAPDHEFASRLTAFLEFGCDVTCYTDEGLGPGEDLIARAEEGLASDLLVLLLSAASCSSRWPRDRWEPVLFDQAREAGVQVVSVLLEDCPFPPLLRRRNFIDATGDRLAAMRLLKRRIWRPDPSPVLSTDLEDLYVAVADRAGTREVSGRTASSFVAEGGQEFEAVLWIPCLERSLAQVAGELGSQLGLTLEGTAEQNCRKIRDLLFERRCLLVLDAPAPEVVRRLGRQGRTSTLVTLDAVEKVEAADSITGASRLVAGRRYAEAYEMLRRLLDAGIETETCARELTWICEKWDRVEEANSLRFLYGPGPSEQLALF
jgi:hypothetical protein